MSSPTPNPVDGRRPGMQISHSLAPIFSEGLEGESLLQAFTAAHGEKGYLENDELAGSPQESVSEEMKRGMLVRGIVEIVTRDVTNDYHKGMIAPGAFDSIPTMVGVIASRTAELTLNAMNQQPSESQGE